MQLTAVMQTFVEQTIKWGVTSPTLKDLSLTVNSNRAFVKKGIIISPLTHGSYAKNFVSAKRVTKES